MIKKFIRILTILSFTTLSAYATENVSPPTLDVKAFMLRDFNSGKIVAAQNGDLAVEPASLTKVMTAYLSFKALKNASIKLTQTLPVSEKAYKVEGSKMFIERDVPVTVDELLHGLIIQSGNDASITLAEGIAGDEENFAKLMNQQAEKLGMKNSHFMNATGLPDRLHTTTALDLSILANALIRDFPAEYKKYYSQKEYRYNNITQPNRNRLLFLDPFVDGMKTGHTENAGYCLIASAKRDQERFISVVLGAKSEAARAIESQKLLNFGFQFYESHLIYKQAQIIKTLKVWKGAENEVHTTVANDLFITIPKGSYSRVVATMQTQKPLVAPLKKGQKIGSVKFTLDGALIDQRDLVSAQDIPLSNLFGRAWDSIKLNFE